MSKQINRKYAEQWLEFFGERLKVIPSITYLWECAQEYVNSGDLQKVKEYENLIFLLHNSVVSPYTRIGANVKFGYGGIGTVIHKDCVIGDSVCIGQNVTLGGTPGSVSNYHAKRINVPHIEHNVYIGAGAKIIGGVSIGAYSIIGANAVVTKSISSFSVVAGQPAKLIKTLNKQNCFQYKNMLDHTKSMNGEQFENLFPVAQ